MERNKLPIRKSWLEKVWEKQFNNYSQYVICQKMNIYPAYTSKHNLNHENQVILLMITHGEGWHYLAVEN